jgi:hypothetical protein
MLAISFPDKSVFMRELLPRICSSKSNSGRVMRLMKALPAAVMGKDHKRQLGGSRREGGRKNYGGIEQKRRTLLRGRAQVNREVEYREHSRKSAMESG